MRKLMALGVSAFLLNGCGFIVHGSRQGIGVSSNPAGARVKVNTGQSCETPCVLDLSRKNSYLFTIEKEGYETASSAVTNKVSGWIVGNILLIDLIGLVVDFSSGGAYELNPSKIDVELKRKSN